MVERSEFEPSVPPSMPLRWPYHLGYRDPAGLLLWVLRSLWPYSCDWRWLRTPQSTCTLFDSVLTHLVTLSHLIPVASAVLLDAQANAIGKSR